MCVYLPIKDDAKSLSPTVIFYFLSVSKYCFCLITTDYYIRVSVILLTQLTDRPFHHPLMKKKEEEADDERPSPFPILSLSYISFSLYSNYFLHEGVNLKFFFNEAGMMNKGGRKYCVSSRKRFAFGKLIR